MEELGSDCGATSPKSALTTSSVSSENMNSMTFSHPHQCPADSTSQSAAMQLNFEGRTLSATTLAKAKKRKEARGKPCGKRQRSDGSHDAQEAAENVILDLSGDSVQQLLQAVRSQTLPYPLPVPSYSHTVEAAVGSGKVAEERVTIIRETVKFFLTYKYWWTSEDYDRIAELVVKQFPDLRDPEVSPTQPCYSKVRVDLSMCARNFRRIAKNQKQRGCPDTAVAKDRAVKCGKEHKTSGKRGSKGEGHTFSPVSASAGQSVQSPLPATTITTTAHRHREMMGTLSLMVSTAAASSASTVLPPVAHFLAHPSEHSQSSGMLPSLLPSPLTSSAASMSSTTTCHASSVPGSDAQAQSDSLVRQPGVTDSSVSMLPAWQHGSQLPDPLPVPPYSSKRHIRAVLSQTARNIRRREVKQHKRDISSPDSSFSAVGMMVKSVPGTQQSSTDFGDLLAAASILESRTAALSHQDVNSSIELHVGTAREIGVINPSVVVPSMSLTKVQDKGRAIDAGHTLRQTIQAESVTPNHQHHGSEEVDLQLCASVKQELGEDQYHLLQAQQAWLVAHMPHTLGSLSGLATSALHMSEQGKLASPPTAHQTTPAKSSASGPQSASSHIQELALAHQACGASVCEGSGDQSAAQVDRMSAMAMWRSTCLPDPLPLPPYSLNVLRARDAGNSMSAKTRIIRETTQFFLSLKMWWTTQDYERIADLVVQHFPDLHDVQHVKKDLGTCARNMRRRLPFSHSKLGVEKSGNAVCTSAGDELSEGESRLGELATMAVRESQDKDKAGMELSVSDEDKAAIAYSVLENNSVALADMYPQSDALSLQGQRPNLSHRAASKVGLANSPHPGKVMTAATLSEALTDPTSLYLSTKHEQYDTVQFKEAGATSLDSYKQKKKAQSSKEVITHKRSEGEIHPVMKDLLTSPIHVPMQDQKLTAADLAAFHSLQTAQQMAVLGVDIVHAYHPSPVLAHSHPQAIRHIISTEEEAPMNLTCTNDFTKQQKTLKIKSEPKTRKRRLSSKEVCVAREQVWLPHGSPYKKESQNVFEALPSPLPVPKYSQKLLKAREDGSGSVSRHRSEIIRETARFFLGFKYWWSSADYTRISELVVEQFPQLCDQVSLPGQPAYRRIQRDLSMCARNLRRKNSRSGHGSSPDTSGGKKTGIKGEPHAGSKAKKMDRQVDMKQGGNARHHQSISNKVDTKLSLTEGHNMAISTHAVHIDSDVHNMQSHYTNAELSYSVMAGAKSFHSATDHGNPTSANKMALPPFSAVVHNTVATRCMDGSASLAVAELKGAVVSSPTDTTACTNTADSKGSEILKASSIVSTGLTSSPKFDCTTSTMPQAKTGHMKGSVGVKEASSLRAGTTDTRSRSNTTAVIAPTLSHPQPLESRHAGTGVFDKVYINPEHGSDLQTQLTKLWQEGKFFDASLEVDDYRLPVHKLVLLAASPYLQSTYSHANPTAHLEVNLPRETGFNAAQDFLKYMYEGVLKMSPSSVNALRRIAVMLQMDQLLVYCDEYLCWLASMSNTLQPAITTRHARDTLTQVLPRTSVSLCHPVHPYVGGEDAEAVMDHAAKFKDVHGIGSLHVARCSPVVSQTSVNASSISLPSMALGTHSGVGLGDSSHKRKIRALDDLTGKRRHEQSVLYKPAYPAQDEVVKQCLAGTVLDTHDQSVNKKQVDVHSLQHAATKHVQSAKCSSPLVSQLDTSVTTVPHCDPVTVQPINSCVQHLQPEGDLYSPSENKEDLDMEDAYEQHTAAALDEEGIMVTLLPHNNDQLNVEGCGEIEITCVSDDMGQLTEEGEVVEQVVIDPGDLLQDVEVAACETVECSLLPQTYCSSPEDSVYVASQSSVLQTMASQWAAEHYAQAPLDAATAQQFAAVLQERMYGKEMASDRHFENGQVLLAPCDDGNVGPTPAACDAVLMLDTDTVIDGASFNQSVVDSEDHSLLPQTYFTSAHSPSHSPPASSESH